MSSLLKKNVPVLVLIAVIVGGAFFYFQSGTTGTYSDTDPTYNKAYWEGELAHGDAKAVYESFKKKNEAAPFGRQHFAAHVMGDAIYSKLGVEGVSVCDALFGFGCYHGFFSRAISEGGEARVKELDTSCVKAFGPLGTGCQHGIGHGILEYVGYQHVNDALALCGQTTEPAPKLGCASGVFMEYNSPLTGSSTALTPTPRDFKTENVYGPCASVPAKYTDTCYYQLGQFIAPNYVNDLPTIAKVCGALTGSARSSCFLGAGEGLTYAAQYGLSAALANCATFSMDDELSCRAGVSWAFYANPQYRSNAAPACAYSDTAKQQKCLALSDLTQGQDSH